ncbi:unnamed protein product [Hyaloperonospora brassicae]|uniref:RxLR effector candidate protein n=1 Tax=Hyaloperonospora brassicae TaxID=162125 RepID=A0AAV0TCC6_HYABA|nr:unnamed protein product [Hyaloperonospora brassicae]
MFLHASYPSDVVCTANRFFIQPGPILNLSLLSLHTLYFEALRLVHKPLLCFVVSIEVLFLLIINASPLAGQSNRRNRDSRPKASKISSTCMGSAIVTS